MTDGDCGKRVIRGRWFSAPVEMRTANRSRIDSGVTAQYSTGRQAGGGAERGARQEGGAAALRCGLQLA